MNMPSDRESDSAERSLLLARAISMWDNEGGASGRVPELVADALPLTNAELVQLQIRVIALENLLAALLVDASDKQLHLAHEIADCITPRSGFTQHRLTIHAATRMINLIERSGHLRNLQSDAENVCEPPLSGPVLDLGSA
jgi:hypothetical protein